MLNKVNLAKLKSIALHSGQAFLAVVATNLLALSTVHSYDAARAVVVSAISAGAVSSLHYLSGFIPNARTSANRAQ